MRKHRKKSQQRKPRRFTSGARRRKSFSFEPLEHRLVLSASPTLIDLDVGGASAPSDFVQVGDVTFFVAEDSTNGRELWVTDGTIQGTQLVADINSGSDSSSPTELINVNGELFFTASDGENGRELWKSDGTVSGTVMVHDIFSGSYTISYTTSGNSSTPTQLTDVDGTLFFTAKDGVNGVELWKSDGTETGTVLVRNINEGNVGDTSTAASSNPGSLTNVEGTLFFTADDGEHGTELWKSDGTESGTVLVKDIFSGTYPYYSGGTLVGDYPNASNPDLFTELDGTLYFVAHDEEHGAELWRSDGTEAGTVLVKDIQEGEEGAFTNQSMAVTLDGALLFTANDGVHGDELWRSDGTEAGTVLVKDIQEGSEGELSYFGGLTVLDGVLYFAADDGDVGKELWMSDGTESGTVLIADINANTHDDDSTAKSSYPFYFQKVNGTLYFSALSDNSGRELWQSDGTAEGTVLVSDSVPGIESFHPNSLTAINGQLFFSGILDGGRELYTLLDSDAFHLSIIVDGAEVEIPANVGVQSDGSMSSTYTVADDGQVFFETGSSLTLSDFFTTWRTDAGVAGNNVNALFSSTQVLEYETDITNTIQVFVNGEVITDFENYVLHSDDDIVVTYGSNPIVSIVTNFGSILVELFEEDTPGTVDNFLNYVNDGDYIDSIFHRSVEDFVIQGGGFTTTSTTFTDTSQFANVPTDDTIANEPGISNLRGTIAMAKLGGDPDSATSQFFINLNDDNTFLDLEENNSFTVFGRILSMTTVDVIASLPIDESNDSPYNSLPLGASDTLVVISAIEGLGELSGTVFYDLDSDGVQDSNEAGISNSVVYIDADNDGVFDNGETFTRTDSDGKYLIQLEAGTYTVQIETTAGATPTLPSSGEGYTVTVEIGREVSGLDFGEGVPLSPSGIDLLDDSDTGMSSEDNLTNLNNTPEKALQFLVSGVVSGAEVRLYASDTLIGSAVATGTEVVVTTNSSVALSDGEYDITATLVFDSIEGEESESLQIVIDTTAPAVISTLPVEIVNQDESFTYDPASADEGGTGMVYSLVDAPEEMSIDSATGEIEWPLTSIQTGPEEFTILLTDSAGNFVSQIVNLTVLGDIPVLPDQYTLEEDDSLTVDASAGVLANDGDNDSGELTSTLVTGPIHGTLTFKQDGSFTYVPDANYFGEDSFTYRAADNVGTGNVAKVTIVVTPLPDDPSPTVDSYAVDEDSVLTVDVDSGVLANDIDVDNDELTATVDTGPTSGTLQLNSDGSFSYTPAADFFGEDSFSYTVSDGTTTSDPVVVTLTVNPLEDVPLATDDSYGVDEDGSLAVAAASGVLANDSDADGDTLSVTLDVGPTDGTLTLEEDGSFTYVPDADFFGTDTFTYLVSDGTSESQAVVTISVEGQPDAPSAIDDDFSVLIDDPEQTLDVLGNDTSDPDDDEALTVISITQGSEGGTVSISSDGLSILYTPSSGFEGTETFTYTIEDEDELTSTATVTVDVSEATNSVLSGFVYVDANGDGVRDEEETGVPGVLVTLTGTTTSDVEITRTALTLDDGSYVFEELAPGTYQLTESQPTALNDGTDSTESEDATVGDDVISELVLTGLNEFVENNFGESRMQSRYTSIVWFFASSQVNGNDFREAIASAEESVGNEDLAASIRDGATTLDVESASLKATDESESSTDTTTEAAQVLSATSSSTSSVGTSALISTPTSGSVALGATGRLVYIPAATVVDFDEFSYQQTNGDSQTTYAAVTISFDQEGLSSFESVSDTSTASLTEPPSFGNVMVTADGAFTYTPNDSLVRSDTFSYQISDETSSVEITVTITVNDSLEDALALSASYAVLVDEVFSESLDWLIA